MSQPSGSESPIPCRVPKVVGERVALQLQMADVSLDELQSYSQFLSAKFGVIVKFQNSHMVQIEGRFERLGELRKFIAQNALKKYGADGNLLKSPSSPLLNNATPQRRIPSGTTSPLVLASERNDIQLQQSFAQMNTFDRNDHCSPGLKADWLCDSPARKRKRDLNAEHNDLESIVNHDGTFLCEICNKSFWVINKDLNIFHCS